MASEVEGVPFAFFCSLLREISQIKPRTTTSRNSRNTTFPALNIFRRWIEELHKRYFPLPPGTTSICFRLLFPEEDTKRKYEVQENRLASYLSRVLGVPHKSLENWDSEDASGCLGNELKRLLEPKFSNRDEAMSNFTIADVDRLLDELAATSDFSDISIRNRYPAPRRSRGDILKILFRQLPPQEAAFMTHIILKDLRPVLYPSPETSCSVSLLNFNTNAVKMLSKDHALVAWDPTRYMYHLHRVKASLSETTIAFELPNHMKPSLTPIIGSMIQLPRSVKGTNCGHALSYFQGSARVWAETKYDGERAQIHVQIPEDGGTPQITIFSKSKRDSTGDRLGLHEIVREALMLGNTSLLHSSHRRPVKKNIVLDAELVAWCNDHVDEFWRIDGLIKGTGTSPRASRRFEKANENWDSGSENKEFDAPHDSQSRHLALVFFDLLVLDDEPLIFQAYSTRRKLLETLLQPIPTRVLFSERHEIDMSAADPDKTLQKIFTEHLANYQEGLVLKAEESEYNDFHLPWVKLKKDYITGFGDCIDLIIVAAGWDRDRARELRVAPNVYTTFWVGAPTNTREIRTNPNTKPHVLVFFTVSYGLDRRQLEDLNFRIRHGENTPFSTKLENYNNLPFTFTISPHLTSKPQTILNRPLLAELLCAGFSKARNCKYYEPRFPRITKIYTKQERPWMGCMDISEHDRIARECSGIDRPAKDIDDWCNSLWGKPSSPSIRAKRQNRVEDIQKTLANLEGISKRRKLDTPHKLNSSTTPNQHITKNTNDRRNSCSLIRDARAFPGVRTDSVQSGIVVSCVLKSSESENCENCLRWKKTASKQRRAHSLESLLIACGPGAGLVDIHYGLIFVHSDDTTMLARAVENVQERRKDIKSQIMIFGCNSDELVAENALFVLYKL